MAKQKQVPGYEVCVTGVYIHMNENGIKTKKFYQKECFNLPEIATYKNGMKEIETVVDGEPKIKIIPNIIKENVSRGNVALHMIRRFYIEERLKEKFPDFVSVKLCEVFSKEKIMMDVDKAGDIMTKPIKEMTLSELRQFVTLNDIGVILSDYNDLGDQKMAVMRAQEQKHKDAVAAGKEQGATAEDELLKESESSLFS